MRESCPAYSIESVHCVLSARETGVIDARRRVEKSEGQGEGKGPAPRTPLAKACPPGYHTPCLSLDLSSIQAIGTIGLCIQIPCVTTLLVQAGYS